MEAVDFDGSTRVAETSPPLIRKSMRSVPARHSNPYDGAAHRSHVRNTVVALENQNTQPQEVADGIFFIEGPGSNWVILRREKDFTVIDGGYPGDITLVVETIPTLGSRAAAMLITHGHIDHTGAAQYFSEEFGTPILSSAELGALLGTEKFQVAPNDIILQAWRLRVFRWMLHVLAAGGLKTNNIKAASVFDAALLAGLPGSPVAVYMAGHTPGHTATCRKPALSPVTQTHWRVGMPSP